MKNLTTFLATLLLAGTLTAQVGDDFQGRRSGAPGFNGLKEMLNLSEEQMTDLLAVQKKMREATQPLMEELRDLAKQLRDVMKSDPVDETAAADLRVAIRAKREEMDAAHRESRLAACNFLTDAQLEILSKLQEALVLQRAVQQAFMLNLIEGSESGRSFGLGTVGRSFMGRGGQPGSGPKPPRQP